MGKVVHTSRINIVRERGPTRKAMIEGFDEPIYYGVHGGIKQFYKVEPEKEHAATLDHIVAATAAWMMGTLATLLAGKKIRTPEGSFRAEVEGDIEDVAGILKITTIRVTYYLKVSSEKAAEAKEAFGAYLSSCPAAQSVIGCIAIQDRLEMEEMTWTNIWWAEGDYRPSSFKIHGPPHIKANLAMLNSMLADLDGQDEVRRVTRTYPGVESAMCVMLVVEDNHLFRTALMETLKTSFPHASVTEAANGKEAITKFDDLQPQIIFLDIKLPDINGLHLAKRMRASNSAAHILMLTSYDQPEYRSAAQANGANHFLVKGTVSPNEITEIVASIMIKRW